MFYCLFQSLFSVNKSIDSIPLQLKKFFDITSYVLIILY